MKTCARRPCCVLLCLGLFTNGIPALAQTPGSLDQTFQAAATVTERAATVFVNQPDGRIVVALPSWSEDDYSTGIVRLRADGSVETTFPYPGFVQGEAAELSQQTDGKILVQGYFLLPGGDWTWASFRMNADGTRDENFSTAALGNRAFQLTVTPHGLLATGTDDEDEDPVAFALRLRFDGSIDPTFPEFRLTNAIFHCVAEANTNIYLLLSSDQVGVIAVLSTNGTWQTNLHPLLPTNFLFWNVMPQREGKLLVRGYFAWGENAEDNGVFRLNADGTTDDTFAPILWPGSMSAVLVDAQDRLLVAARSCDDNGECVTRVIRFHPDGTADGTFQSPPIEGEIKQMALQADGRILIGGSFIIETNVVIANLARLNGDGASPPPSLHLGAPEFVVSENARDLVVFTIRNPGDSAVSFDVWMADGSALAGQDYGSVTGRVSVAAGQPATIRIPILDDRLVNGPREFTFGISNLFGAEPGTNMTARVVIQDDEVTNRVQFSAVYFPVKETQARVRVEVVRDFGSPGAVRVAYRTRDGTAAAGRDFLPSRGILEFGEGQFTNSFVVPILDTRATDGNRYAALELFNAENGAVLAGQTNATLAILDDESPALVVAPTEAFLRAAIAGGGDVRFATGGIVEFSSPALIEQNTSIDANGYPILLTGNAITRHFTIARNAHVTFSGLTFLNGRSTNGGAIYNEGVLELRDCLFSNNMAQGLSGPAGLAGTNGQGFTNNPWQGTPGQNGERGTAGDAAAGGAIFNSGELSALNCSFLRNSAVGGNGGSGGTGGHAIGFGEPGNGGDAGDAGGGHGGAIHSVGEGRFTSCKFMDNAALAGAPGSAGRPGTNSVSSYSQQRAAGNPGRSADAGGGAIHSLSSIALTGCEFQSNVVMASDGGSGAASSFSSPAYVSSGTHGGHGPAGQRGGHAFGGALLAFGHAAARSNLWTANSAIAGHGGHGAGGGAAWSRRDTTFLGGDGGHGGLGGFAFGGAIYGEGALSLQAEVFSANQAVAGLGGNGGHGGHSDGMAFGRNPTPGNAGVGGNAHGGAISHRGSFEGVLVRAQMNSAAAAGGGAAASPGTGRSGLYSGAGAAGPAGESGHAFGGAIAVEGTSLLSQCELSGNVARGGHGTNGWTAWYCGTCKFSPPSGRSGTHGGWAFGGGAYLDGTSSVQQSSFALNRSAGGNGGNGGNGAYSLYQATSGGRGGNGGDTYGGGLFVRGIAEVVNSTVALNDCKPGHGGSGGTGDASQYSPPASIDPTRPGGNAGVVLGSGIGVGTNSSARIAFSTIASNGFLVATGGAGGISTTHFRAPDGTNTLALGTGLYGESMVTLSASILAGEATPQAGGSILDGGFNLSSDSTPDFTQPGSRNDVHPRLGPLANNGGPTRTMALIAGSPAINAADNSGAPPTDQRGVARPFGGRSDIGAFELDQRTFTIRGRVFGGPAMVTAGSISAVVDEQGFYTLPNLLSGSYVVRPSSPLTEFNPSVRSVRVGPDKSGVNFVTAQPCVQMAGSGDAGGGILTRILGQPRRQYLLESSTNLVEWRVEAVGRANQNGWLDWRTDVSTNEPQRYFRARRR